MIVLGGGLLHCAPVQDTCSREGSLPPNLRFFLLCCTGCCLSFLTHSALTCFFFFCYSGTGMGPAYYSGLLCWNASPFLLPSHKSVATYLQFSSCNTWKAVSYAFLFLWFPIFLIHEFKGCKNVLSFSMVRACNRKVWQREIDILLKKKEWRSVFRGERAESPTLSWSCQTHVTGFPTFVPKTGPILGLQHFP